MVAVRVCWVAAAVRFGRRGDVVRRYWISFANDTTNLGVTVVDSPNEMMAVIETHLTGINPGGQVAIYDITDHIGDDDAWMYAYMHGRLWTRDELEALGVEPVGH